MAYLGNAPTSVPLSSADILDGAITSAKIANGAITGDDINSTFNLTGKTVTLPAGTGGKVLQIIHTSKTTIFTTSSSSYVDITGLTATITPSSTSSKILVMCNTNLGSEDQSGGLIYLKIMRGISGSFVDIGVSTDARTAEHAHIERECNETATNVSTTRHNILFLDSPSSTSAVTYKALGKTNGVNAVVIGASGRSDSNTADTKFAVDIILMEIGS